MFEVDPERSWVDPAAGSISHLIQSLNTPLVAAGTHPAENVQSWIVSRQKATVPGAHEVFVYFHLTQSNQAVLYRWDGGSVPQAQLEYVQEEAMSFCESMGFMMDDLNFSSMPPQGRGELQQSLPPFIKDLATLVQEVVGEVEVTGSRKVDPLDDFQRAKAARAESGQANTADFVAAAGPEEPILTEGFDPSAPGAMIPEEEMQIEITEVDGLDLVPADSPAAAMDTMADVPGMQIEIEASDPGMEIDPGEPSVEGSEHAIGQAGANVSVEIEDDGPLPIARGREITPPEPMNVIDGELFGAPAPSPAAAVPATVAPRPPGTDEISIDDMLADVGPNGEVDLSTQLDDILDGVDSGRGSRAPAAPLSSPLSMGEISRAFEMSQEESGTVSPDEAMAALDALGLGDSLMGGPAPAPGNAAATEILSVDSILGPEFGARSPAPAAKPAPASAKPPARPAPASTPVPAVESAWAATGEFPMAGNGNGKAASLPPPAPAASASSISASPSRALDVSTNELARLLAML